ncbi:hypothetical protein VNO78_14175 [Psophocarpus tetragonolobus]|uniref:Uncharacterized protein n=1 Tax=Psophocarpus tetragonolobus TaxID=3891 RepID=A0AAN9XQD2_PSOTE
MKDFLGEVIVLEVNKEVFKARQNAVGEVAELLTWQVQKEKDNENDVVCCLLCVVHFLSKCRLQFHLTKGDGDGGNP